MNLFDLVQGHFVLYLLVLTRCLVFVWFVPPFGLPMVLPQIRIAVGLILSVLLCMGQGWPEVAVTRFVPLMIHIVKEALVGGLLALTVVLIFVGLRLAGEFISQQMGMDWGSSVDSDEEEESSGASALMFLFGVLVFVLINGHHTILQMLNRSFLAVPVSQLHVDESFLSHGVGVLQMSFVLALKIAFPALVIFFLASAVLMIISRSIPQFDAFLASLPLRVALGLFSLTIVLPLVILMMQDSVGNWAHVLS